MKRRFFLCMTLALSCLVSLGVSAGFATEKVYINGHDPSYPPFTFIDKSGKSAGFDVDVVDWIAKEMGFKVKHKPIEWSAIIPSLKAKKIDLIASGMTITSKRQSVINFTDPYWTVTTLVVAKKDSNLSVQECFQEGRKLGLIRGGQAARWVEENLIKKGKKFKVMPYDSVPLAIEEVVNGRIDAAAVQGPALKEAQGKGFPVKSIGRLGQPDKSYGIGVRKEDTRFLEELNEGLRRLKATAYWNELIKKWGL